MKRLTLFLICVCPVIGAYAQNIAVNADGNSADPSAILDVSSNEKGILIPRMTTSERTAITNPAQGLMVFDTFTRSFWFYSNGWNEISNGGATGPAGGDLNGNYPAPTVVKIQNRDISASAPGDKQVLKWDDNTSTWKAQNDSLSLPFSASLSQTGAIFGITNTNSTAGSSALYGKRGSGSGINPATTAGVWGDNVNGLGVLGTSNTGIGVYGFAQMNHGVYGYSTTAGWAGVKGSHANAGGVGVMGEIQVSGIALLGQATGTAGKAGKFVTTNETHQDTSLVVSTAGLGSLSTFNATNASNNYPAIGISHAGNGTGLKVMMNNPSVNAFGVDATVKGTGIAGRFVVDNSANENAAQWVTTNGTGSAAYFKKDNTSGAVDDPHLAAVIIDNNSKGSALNIQSMHSPSNNSAVYVNYGGDAYGLDVHATGKAIHAISGGQEVMVVENSGGGIAIDATGHGIGLPAIESTNNAQSGIGIKGSSSSSIGVGVFGEATGGVGSVGVKGVSSSTSTFVGAVTGLNDTTGIAVYGEAQNGTGVKGISSSSSNSGVYGVNNGSGAGVHGYASGGDGVGVWGQANGTGGISIAVLGSNSGDGDGVRGFAGTGGSGISGFDNSETGGHAGNFGVYNTSNTSDAVTIYNGGLGRSLYINASNASNTGNMIVFQSNGTGNYAVFRDNNFANKIRFDNSGKGFFNGGTQTGGADFAEAFDTDEDIGNYEPGDVLAISTTNKRSVTKSSEPYSDLVAGVYATKPGVLMTEEQIDTDLSDKVPMGVVGVIPTKVCAEGGVISIGDLLVTSSIPGVAMKGNKKKIRTGQVLGKALDNYSGNGVGKIKVLVNVQ